MAKPASAVAPYIYLNGHPGVGKHTIAQELSLLIPASRVYHNHLIIDPVTPILERDDPAYQPLRRQLRQLILGAIVDTKPDITWILTDNQSTDYVGRGAATDHRAAAERRGAPFVSVVLHCDPDENERRLTAVSRGRGSMKLIDAEILRQIRRVEEIICWGDELEMQLDVTRLSAAEAAERIRAHVERVTGSRVP